MRWTGQERRPPASLGPRAARLQATSRSRGRRRRRACPTTSRDRPRRSGGPLRRSGSRGRSSEPTPWRARAGARTSHDRPRPCSRQHPRCARTRPGWPDRAARRPAARRAGGRRLRSWRGGWWDRPRSLGARTCRRGVPVRREARTVAGRLNGDRHPVLARKPHGGHDIVRPAPRVPPPPDARFHGEQAL